MSINDVTGDRLVSKASTEKYRNNFDAIFKKCKKEFPCELKGDTVANCKCTNEKAKDENNSS